MFLDSEAHTLAVAEMKNKTRQDTENLDLNPRPTHIRQYRDPGPDTVGVALDLMLPTLTTVHPARLSRAWLRTSLRRFPSILASHFSLSLCRQVEKRQPCQKSPSTNIATL